MLWGVWLLTHAVVFSFASGILHPYYTVAMAPAVGALVGGGAVELWRSRSRWIVGGLLASIGLVATAWWGSQLLARTPDFVPGLGTLELALTVAAAAVLLLPRLRVLPARLPAAALAVGLVAAMLGPTAYAFSTAGQAQNSPDPHSGPAGAARAFGVPGGAGRFVINGGPGGPGAGPGGFAGGGAPPGAQGGGQGGFGFAPGGAGGTDSALLSYLQAHQGGATWLAAVASANQAAPMALATGKPVLAMGGFSGGDQAMTVEHLQELVRTGQLRYVLANGGGRGGPDQGSQSVTSWVTQHCTLVNGVGSGLYDCTTAAGGSGV